MPTRAATRAFSLATLALVVGCSSSVTGAGGPTAPVVDRPSLECRAIPGAVLTGESASVRVEIGNPTTSPVTIEGWTVPWQYHWAIKFDGDATDPLIIADPGTYPAVIIAPGQTASGDVAIGTRLQVGGRHLGDVAGTYHLRARSSLRSGGDSVDVSCTFKLTVLARTPALERAIAAAKSTAAAKGYDLAIYPLTDVREENGSFDLFFERIPPEPPGGHFTVRVDAKGAAELFPGA